MTPRCPFCYGAHTLHDCPNIDPGQLAQATIRRDSWDTHSGIRERLALLAVEGPTLDPLCWSYNPRLDTWFYSGLANGRAGDRIALSVGSIGEASAALARIARNHGLDRREAMTLIGYPESR